MQSHSILALLLSLIFLSSARAPLDAAAVSQTAPGSPAIAHSAPPSLAPMLASVAPAVVNISVQGTMEMEDEELFDDPLLRRFFGMPQSGAQAAQRFRAAGSGIIYDAVHGYILTNYHVVERADKIQVTLKDGRQFEAKRVAVDTQSDIALLNIPAQALTALPLGASSALQVGDYVVSIGNPFGVGQTATFGIVSALGRTGLGLDSYEDFIQTDASINPGSSGGALVDMQGRLVGMNAAIISRGGGNIGIGFAVPIDIIKPVVEQLISHGKVSRGTLGVVIQDLTPSLARAMHINVTSGALVAQVLPQSAAEKAGIVQGDVIIALDGAHITASSQLRNAISQRQPKTSVRLSTVHDGAVRNISVVLDAQGSAAPAKQPEKPAQSAPLLGMVLMPIPHDDPRYGNVTGAYVESVEPQGAAEEAGLRDGDIIVRAGQTAIKTPAELAKILAAKPKDSPLLLQIRRGNAPMYVALE